MGNKTQRNFKKEMKKLKKERVGQDDKVYSFIEKREIKDYYEPRKRRKRKILGTLGLGGLILILWNTFALWTWINPLLPDQVQGSLKKVFTNYTTSAQEEIFNYFSTVEEIEKRLFSEINDFKVNLQGDFENNIEFKSKLESLILVYSEEEIKLSKVNPPEKAKDHKNILVESCENMKEALGGLLELDDRNSMIASYNLAIGQLNNDSYRGRMEMLAVFDKAGIEYTVKEDGRIEYKIK